MPSRSCFFHELIWAEWTWYLPDSSARVLVCSATSRVTRALKAAGYHFLVPVMTLLGMEK